MFVSRTSDSMPNSNNVAKVSAAQIIWFICLSVGLITDEKSSKTCF